MIGASTRSEAGLGQTRHPRGNPKNAKKPYKPLQKPRFLVQTGPGLEKIENQRVGLRALIVETDVFACKKNENGTQDKH